MECIVSCMFSFKVKFFEIDKNRKEMKFRGSQISAHVELKELLCNDLILSLQLKRLYKYSNSLFLIVIISFQLKKNITKITFRGKPYLCYELKA